MPRERRSTRATQVAQRIQARIHADGCEDGDLFMTEAQVASEFGVSRNITREAVSRLRGLGMLESRKRKGLIVRRPCPIDLLSQSLPMLARSAEDVNELARLRYVMEIGAIELVVANADEAQIAELARRAAEFESAFRSRAGCDRENEMDLAFHGVMLQMTGSRMVAGMQRILAKFFQAVYPGDAWPATDASVWQHHELVAAIRERDLERARAMLRLHFQPLLSISPDAPPG